jgi:hypothetical protein
LPQSSVVLEPFTAPALAAAGLSCLADIDLLCYAKKQYFVFTENFLHFSIKSKTKPSASSRAAHRPFRVDQAGLRERQDAETSIQHKFSAVWHKSPRWA